MENDGIRYGFMGGHGIDSSEFARAAEALGADAVAWGESPTQFNDPYIGMSLAAQVTSRARLGTVMTCPGLRHPAALANSFMEVQRVSGGRAFCGIGTGDLALIEMGEKPVKMNEFVRYSKAVKDLIAGEEISWNDHAVRMKLAPVERVPLWFGADGPRGIQAAGQVADGIIVGQVGGPDVVREVIARATTAAEAAGRSIDDLEIWFMLRVLVTEEDDGAIDVDGLDEYATRGLRYLWRTSGRPEREAFGQAMLDRKGLALDADIVDRLYEFNQRWDESAAFGTKVNVDLMDDLGLREFAARYFYISGPPERVADGVRALMDAGARNFFTPFLAADPVKAAHEIAPILNGLR
jgi:alkanesulfonate monooxygenase SsuD/methylene tetrahydromethanopterin reductase-like flavin-dependent oxidoreductase (luciferase family)